MLNPELQIQLGNIEENIKYYRSIVKKNVEVGIVVKSNAYGLGLKKIVGFLNKINLLTFFTATLNEAIEVRKIAPKATIYTLNGFDYEFENKYRKYKIFPVLNSLNEIKKIVENSSNVDGAAVQINTGMNRLGISIGSLRSNIDLIRKVPLTLIMSHLACADEFDSSFNNYQRDEFLKCCEYFPNIAQSLSASYGTLLDEKYHFDLIRLGIGAYGGIQNPNLKPVIQVKAPVIQTHIVEKGMGIGYNRTFKAQKKMKIATVATGYGDGISRLLSNRGVLFAGNTKCPILGRISMDLITLDISHLKFEPTYLNFFSNEYDINEMAKDSQTISYEVLVKLGSRFKRRFFL